MNNQKIMFNAAYKAMIQVFEVSAKDNVLILTDVHSKTIVNAFRDACFKIGCEEETYQIDESKRPLKEPPEKLIKMLPGKNVVFNMIKNYLLLTAL